jgi:hypothetical protein
MCYFPTEQCHYGFNACACRKAGRDSGLLPVAIELASRATISGSQGVVYSRDALAGKGGKKEVLWRLAKAVFRWAAASAVLGWVERNSGRRVACAVVCTLGRVLLQSGIWTAQPRACPMHAHAQAVPSALS